MEFAQDRKRNEAGWIIYPSDTTWRKSLFPPQVMKHPAKMQMWLEKDIIEYVSQPGDTIMDPTAGTGTIMIAALEGRTVICLDIEERYHQLEQEAYEGLKRGHPNMSPVILLLGDCRFSLPIPCNHIITSPPYASALHYRVTPKPRSGPRGDEFVEMDIMTIEYNQNQRNLGRLNNFLYNQAMERIYKLYYESILPGGTLTIVLKDRMEKGKRISLTGWADRVCTRLGFTPIGRWKWDTPGIQFTAINKSHGLEVVEDEDIMIYRRER